MTLSWRTRVGMLVLALTAPVLATSPSGAATEPGTPEPPGSGSALARSDSPLVVPDEPRAVGNIAHRGASVAAPENTMAAIRQAVAQHANFVGIDVRRTRDHRLVVLHDKTLDRTTDVETVFPGRAPWAVEDFTLTEVKRLDAGSWMSPIYTGERIPTLAEMLKALAPSRTGAFLEVKHPFRYGGLDGVGTPVVDAIRRHTDWLAPDGPERRLVVQAYSRFGTFLRAFAKTHPDVPIGVLGDVRSQLTEYEWAGQVNLHHSDVSADLVTEAHRLGLAVGTYTVNEVPRMVAVVDAGVDAVATDHPDRLRTILRKRGRELVDPAAEPEPEEPARVTWSLTVPSRAQLLGTRAPVSARLRTLDGAPARWAWVRLEQRTGQGWKALQRPRATDGNGELHTTVAARAGLRLRMRSVPGPWHRETVSTSKPMPTRRATTTGALTGNRRLADSRTTRLRVRWLAEDGRGVTGHAGLWARPRGGNWARRGTLWVEDGNASVPVRPRVDTRYELRLPGGSWWAGDEDRHYIDNLPSGRVVRLPAQAPRPSVRLSAQPRVLYVGLDASVSRIDRSTWNQMRGRSWHPGCPVGRAGLRLVRLNYWGYDGYRHRGELVVARKAARPVVRAFGQLYIQGYPIRSMYRVSRFPGGITSSLAAGNTSGFACAGARRPGPHAHGRTLTVNPWENPDVNASGVMPNRWWLSRARRSEQVHDSRRHPAVGAFAAHGFRWGKGGRDYGRFRLR